MGRPIIQRLGRVFGKLTVVAGPDRRVQSGRITAYWLCRCDCGEERWHAGSQLQRGLVKSCGCSMGQYIGLANRQRNPSGRRQREDGYVSVRTPTGWRMEHSVVMEQKLGRPLLPTEEVHHKNTIRNDNAPNNLELWVKSRQPKGGRVEDLISWAVDLLKQYHPEVLDTAAGL